MGVLDAWKDAEKVGYPVVGEVVKDASDVIDYDIREEQTIDQSSVVNANNDTTTGMANVIPGINAPKLIASTSIIGDLGGGGGSDTKSLVKVPISYFNTGQIQPLTTGIEITNEGGAGFIDSSGTVKVGKAGIYLIHIEIPYVFGSPYFSKTIKIYRNGTTLVTSVTLLNQTETQEITVGLAALDGFTFTCEMNDSGGANLNGTMTLLFTKQ